MLNLFAQLKTFAHAGEVHEESVESANHLLDTWYTALPIAVLVVVAVGFLAYYLFKKSISAAFLAVNLTLLVIGVFAYSHSAVVSIVSLSLGFAMCLGGVLSMLLSKGSVSKK